MYVLNCKNCKRFYIFIVHLREVHFFVIQIKIKFTVNLVKLVNFDIFSYVGTYKKTQENASLLLFHKRITIFIFVIYCKLAEYCIIYLNKYKYLPVK